MDRRAARSSDTDLKERHSKSLLSPLQPLVSSACNSVQFLAMAVREVSVMLVPETSNLCNPVQFSEMEMVLASVMLRQLYRFNDCSPVQ